jgi:hypothetical protein
MCLDALNYFFASYKKKNKWMFEPKKEEPEKPVVEEDNSNKKKYKKRKRKNKVKDLKLGAGSKYLFN